MNIILITSYSRPELFNQTVDSLVNNSTDWGKHRMTTVFNGPDAYRHSYNFRSIYDTLIICGNIGASRSRNIGASSIPKYIRQQNICFFDDDVYCCPGWDEQIEKTIDILKRAAVSGHAHPYNHPDNKYRFDGLELESTQVLSTVNIACSWAMWGDVGYFVEPGGPGGSEDVEWCKRAVDKDYGLAVTSPQCVIHCGLTSSSGKDIVGRELVEKRNKEIERAYGIEGKVRYE